uniref:Chromosome 1 open reading frame 94 n=1 Tax=Sphenodon punctatus TaxID=8508 RepID=A0A8D0L6A4_SPHPU
MQNVDPAVGDRLRSLCDAQLSTKSTVSGILLPAKFIYKSSKGVDKGSVNAANTHITKLVSQFPLKHLEAAKAPYNKAVVEDTKRTKDSMQMFSSTNHKESTVGPLLPLTATESQAPEQKKQLPVFAKICSKTYSNSVTEGLSQNMGKDSRHWPENFDGTSMESWERKHPQSQTVWVGLNPDTPSSQISSLDTKLHCLSVTMFSTMVCIFTVTTAALDKNNLKYSGNIFTPRFPTTSSTTTLNQPVWFGLNYAPPPVFPNHSNFTQYQGLYQQRARLQYQQALHPPLGCYSRQVTPYNPQQLFRSPYTPVLSYIPLVQPGYSYQQRNPSKPTSSAREPPAMAGDGPQYQFSHSYGFSSTAGGSIRNKPYFSSSVGANNF